MSRENFQTFALEDPATCVIHHSEEPASARVVIMASVIDVKLLALMMSKVMENEGERSAMHKAASTLHDWLEGAYEAFTDAEREAANG